MEQKGWCRVVERLTKRTLTALGSVVYSKCDFSTCNYDCKECSVMEEVEHKLKEYEDAEEQGLLIRVPYPLGTRKLYWACDYDFEIYTLDALKFTPCRSDVGEISYLIDDYEFCEDDFGKILFLTKEEAEQALAEMEK